MKKNKCIGKQVKVILADSAGGQNIEKIELKGVTP